MLLDRDIWLAAGAMIQRYGSNAGMEAAERADELLGKGEMEVSRDWVRILAAIERLQATKPGPGETVQ
jgi:hypothetical protein